MKLHPLPPPRPASARKIVVAVVGTTVLLLGTCLLVLPGPGVLVIAAGGAILATEFVWAKRWLAKSRELVGEGQRRWRNWNAPAPKD